MRVGVERDPTGNEDEIRALVAAAGILLRGRSQRRPFTS